MAKEKKAKTAKKEKKEKKTKTPKTSSKKPKEEKTKDGPNAFQKAFRAIVQFKWAYLLFAAMFIAAGVGFIGFPDEAVKGVRIGIGVAAIAFSVFAMVLALSNKSRGFLFWAKMVGSGLGLITGCVVVFANGGYVFTCLVYVLGLFMIIDASFKMQTAILSHRYRFWLWWVLVVLVTTAIVMGVWLLRSDFSVDSVEDLHFISRLAGIGFILDGLLNLISIVFLYQIEGGQREEIIRELERDGRLVPGTAKKKKKKKSDDDDDDDFDDFDLDFDLDDLD